MPTTDRTERIAIVGVGGIFPGAPDLATFWRHIQSGFDAGRHVPRDRWYLNPETALDRSGTKTDRVYSTWGCFIEGFQFDPIGLNLDQALVSRLDPLFHLGLHAARAAFGDARHLVGVDLSRVGVILGNIALPTESTSEICRDVLGRTLIEKLLRELPLNQHRRADLSDQLFQRYSKSDWHPVNRLAASLPAALIAQGLNLGGAAFTLDAACASSLYALKFACEELLANRADAMLAGGMSRPDCQYTQMGFAQLKALSKQGRCAPLSAAADGLVVGEGAGVFVLKRLSDALSAGDQIYAVIAGIGLSNDRGANLLAPHSEGQLRAMRSAYREAGWRPSDVDLIECHATGTPVGDAVEISSLHQLWEHESSRPGQCVIGGVKSNVGHLLTGAGAAGLMKVLLSIKHQTLPPTANYVSPAESLARPGSPFRVLAQAENWPRRSGSAPPRRATVNAFGFGGINAHLLIEEFAGVRQSDSVTTTFGSLSANVPAVLPPARENVDIAIVGCFQQTGAALNREHWGVEQSDWYRREFGLKELRYRAISSVNLPLGRFRIPPVEMQDMLPQQQLMLQATAEALRQTADARNSGSQEASEELGNRTGVFIGIELDPNTTNFHLRWSVEECASKWAATIGLQLAPAELEVWVQRLKDTTGPGLTANRVMGNLGGIVASRLAREFNIGGPSFTISSAENSGLRACEIAANALRRGELDRAIVGAVDLPCDIRNQVMAQRESSQADSAITTDGVTALVLKRLEDAKRDGDRIQAVIRQIQVTEPQSRSIQEDGFSAGAATGLLDLAGATQSLSSQILEKPTRQFWLRNRCDGLRTVSVPGRGIDGQRISFELIEPLDEGAGTSAGDEAFVSRTAALPAQLFVVEGDDLRQLSEGLNQLSARAAAAGAIERLAAAWINERPLDSQRSLAICLIANSPGELVDVIELSHQQLRDHILEKEPDRRIYFSRVPIGSKGRLAFVFPGSGNAFSGMGRELLALFPEILRRQDAENERLRDQYRPDLIWHNATTAELLENHKVMIFGQVALVTAICDLLAGFNLHPTASIGYSLGESAAFFGLRAWTDRDEMLRRMEDSALFGSELVRPFQAARQAWNLPAGVEVDWISGLIDQPADTIRRELVRLDQQPNQRRVDLLIVNTLNQCVIGGERDQVMMLVGRLGASFIPFAAPSTVHCAILRQVEPAYRALHVMRTTPPSQPNSIDFYSTAWGRSYELDRESAADAIVAQALDTIDFPQVIETAYADGVRLFVEIGPGSSCTRLVDEILGERVHLARSATPVTGNPVLAFLELLAALIAERAPIDLRFLYGPSVHRDRTDDERPSTRDIVTQTDGAPFQIPVPDSGWAISHQNELGLEKIAPASPAREDFATVWEKRPESHRDWIPSPIIASSDAGDFTRYAMNSNMIHAAADPLVIEDQVLELTGQHESEYPKAAILMNQMDEMLAARNKAHEAYLRVSAEAQRIMTEQLSILAQLPGLPDGYIHQSRTAAPEEETFNGGSERQISEWIFAESMTSGDDALDLNQEIVKPIEWPEPNPPRSLDRRQCMEFAIGKIGRALGALFAEIDQHPTRVRLPDEPLMLVDRILEIEGEPLSMTNGRVVTEHDIHPGAWYLDCNRIPTCIAVEAGQADLFLSGWLGIDFETKGLACYRLLDAVVTFHRELPPPGRTIHYNIRINHFFRQGQTYLFRFEFDATVDGLPLLTMRDGCAGFFTEAELAGGKGIVHTALDRQPRPGKRTADWTELVPMIVESLNDDRLCALREGRLADCFGANFAGLPLHNPVTIPGLTRGGDRTRMWLIDRVLKLDPAGGKYGLGTILGELDIHPDDWFLICHFCDDQVMPGTLMYECCLHTLRIFLLRMGWVGDVDQVVYEPIPGFRSRLKCRGQVRAETKKVWYEINLKEIGYSDATSDSPVGTPYCLADALMYADGKPIVEITDMSIRLSGLTRESLESIWRGRRPSPIFVDSGAAKNIHYDRRPAIFDTDRITAFAIGKPSEAFGDRYQVFDSDRVIARLPGPPFQFLDRIVEIKSCQPWVLAPGGEIVAQYDVPPDAWYFAANRQRRMPFAVLLETALQPCGWLAAYVGSALASEFDVSFRNLGGSATQYADVTPDSGTLTTLVKMTRVSNSGGMIIQHYDFDLRCDDHPVYVGNTYFGFFSKPSLANQIGIRDAKPFAASSDELSRAIRTQYADHRPFADARFQMIDEIDISLDQGPNGHGFAIGRMTVKPEAWFFKAHFYQDPVVPGSLGLESFFQLLKFYAVRRWNLDEQAEFTTPILEQQSTVFKARHEWVYRGQVIPRDTLVTVSAVISSVDDARRELSADGYLSVDGRTIYQMKNFTLGLGR